MKAHGYGWIGCIAVLSGMLFLACREDRQRPTNALSEEQSRLSSVIGAGAAAGRVSPVLSRELSSIVASEFIGDSSGALIAAFNEKFDQAVLQLSSKLFMETDGRRIAGSISDYIFTTWGITFNEDRDNRRYLFPHLVVAGKQGSCVGMSLLYLLIAEKMDLPLFAVRAPGHLFVRYDNGTERCNIETLRKGEVMDDAWYRRRWSIRDTALYPLDNLTTSGVLAVIHYNLGTICMNEGNHKKSLAHLEKAIKFLPDFPEAQGNLALVRDALGDSRTALEILAAIRDAHPSFENIDRNLASLQLKCAKYDDALATYSELTCREPGEPQFHYGRGVALFHLKRALDAENALRKVLTLQPDHQGAQQLLARIKN